MSLDATRWAWQQSGIKSSDKLVLLSMADRADEMHMCWPAVSRIAADTCLNKDTVIASIERLIQAGLLEKKKRWGQSPIYHLIGVIDRHTIPVNQNSGKAEFQKPGIMEAKNDTSNMEIQNSGNTGNCDAPVFRKPGNSVFRKPGKESTNESTNENYIKKLFEEFWGFWPKRQGKAEALKVFEKLHPDDALITQMRSDVSRRLATGAWLDKKFIMDPARYLRGRRWEDEIDGAQPGAPPVDDGSRLDELFKMAGVNT